MSMKPTTLSLYWETDSGVEEIDGYVAGGYHPVAIGDVFKSSVTSYQIVHKLRQSAFATVWLSQTLPVSGEAGTSSSLVSLKICVASADSQRELNIYDRLPPGKERHVISLLDTFSIRGPNGTHDVLVQNVVGSFDGLRDLVRKQAREVCKQIIQGVAFLHTQGVMHGDLHARHIGFRLPRPKNHTVNSVLTCLCKPEISLILPRQPMSCPDALPMYLVSSTPLINYLKRKDPTFIARPLRVEIMDLSNASILGEPPSKSASTTVCAPEFMPQRGTTRTDLPSTFASDMWCLACTLYEVVFGECIFDRAESSNGDLRVAIAKLCGEVPPEWAADWVEPEYLDEPISQETADAEWKRRLNRHEADWKGDGSIYEFGALLRTMLQLDPSARPDAVNVLQHPWFNNRPEGSIPRMCKELEAQEYSTSTSLM